MEATLTAVTRETIGKNEARRLRASGKVPGVLYGAQKQGDEIAPVMVAVDPKSLLKILHSDSGANTLISLTVGDGGVQRVMVKEYQLDPITHQLLHADFYRVNLDRKIQVPVPVLLKGESKGVKNQGGVVDFLHREITVECLPTAIPDSVEIDITELGLGQAVYVRDVATSASWSPVTDVDTMLVHIVAPKVEAVAAEAAAAPAAAGSEPEVIKKGKTEKEGEDKGKK
jgi:large subunit ribosomal protein L25